MAAASTRSTAWLVLFSLFVCYLALAPCTTGGRGYTYEDMQSGLGALSSFNAWVKGRPVPAISWTRHGPVPLLLDLPFIKAGKLFVSPDFVLSLQPVLLTAGLLAILYLWLTRLCTPGMSLLLTLIGAFTTMLWPYAYIGLETKQAFFIVAAGYLGLAGGKIRTWPRLALFSIVCALAISVKSTGVILAPVIAYLIYVQYRDDWKSRRKQVLAVLLIVGGIWAVGVLGWRPFWNTKGGSLHALGEWTIHSPFQYLTNAIGLFGSPTKGLFVFAPALVFSIFAFPRALSRHRETAVFALLVTVCTVAFLSILSVPADELWGPRFMHVTNVPLLLVLGAAWSRFRWRRHLAVVILSAVGFAVSFLGAFYYYGARGAAARAADQNVLEWLAGDNVWNEVLFDARLFEVWIRGGSDPALWTPSHTWAWEKPPDAQSWKTVNLREYADPQSFLLYYWNMPLSESDRIIFRICLAALIAGPLLLAWTIARTVRMTRSSPIPLSATLKSFVL